MKLHLKKIAIIMIALIAYTSCSDDDTNDVPISELNELDGLTKFKEMSNATHTIELYSTNDGLSQGYNEIKLRIKDNGTDNYVKNAQLTWMPMMHMAMLNHSSPKSTIEKVTIDGNLYEGYIMFQMAQNATEYWDLKIDYTIDGVDYTVTSEIDVPATEKRMVNSFLGSDGVKYLVAYIAPSDPKVAINDLVVGVWKMEDMMNFPMVDGYTVRIDPRMPSMGNHSSPNNVDAVQGSAGEFYNGKLSLTMTGYWKINLQLAQADGIILKGEEITSTVESSSIFFEIEF